MRRYAFYLTVALLAFGIGSFVVFKFYWRAEESTLSQTVEIHKSEIKEQTSKPEVSQDEQLNGEEKLSFEVLKPTIKKWLRGEKIRNEFTEVSDESIKEITGRDKSELTEDEKTWFSYLGFDPTLFDVDGDGNNELAIRNECAAVGNCQFQVFKKKNDKYETILSITDNTVQTFKLRKNKTNGYFDLETKDHNDAWSSGIYIYMFNGKKYKLNACYEYNYSYLRNGKLHELKKPLITQLKCSDE